MTKSESEVYDGLISIDMVVYKLGYKPVRILKAMQSIQKQHKYDLKLLEKVGEYAIILMKEKTSDYRNFIKDGWTVCNG